MALALPGICAAHVGADAGVHHDAMSALWTGFVHPFSGVDHWAAMVALGVWSATTARRVLVAPFVFAVMLVVGAMLGFMNAPMPVVEPMIACSVLVLGLLVAMRWQVPAWAAAVMAGVFALFHGVAHGVELAGPFEAFALAGMLVAALLLQGVGMVLGGWAPRHAPWLQRLGGAALALFGAVLLGPFA
jgi:urease accessory protein